MSQRAENVSLSVYQEADGRLRVWGASWTMSGTLPPRRTDLSPREASKQHEIDRKALEKRITQAVMDLLNADRGTP